MCYKITFQSNFSQWKTKTKCFVMSSVTIFFTLNVKEVTTRDSIKQATENLWSSSWLKRKQTAVLNDSNQTAIKSSIYNSL